MDDPHPPPRRTAAAPTGSPCRRPRLANGGSGVGHSRHRTRPGPRPRGPKDAKDPAGGLRANAGARIREQRPARLLTSRRPVGRDVGCAGHQRGRCDRGGSCGLGSTGGLMARSWTRTRTRTWAVGRGRWAVGQREQFEAVPRALGIRIIQCRPADPEAWGWSSGSTATSSRTFCRAGPSPRGGLRRPARAVAGAGHLSAGRASPT